MLNDSGEDFVSMDEVVEVWLRAGVCLLCECRMREVVLAVVVRRTEDYIMCQVFIKGSCLIIINRRRWKFDVAAPGTAALVVIISLFSSAAFGLVALRACGVLQHHTLLAASTVVHFLKVAHNPPWHMTCMQDTREMWARV
jgi:hypothetical protein